MAEKKPLQVVKLQLSAGKATPAPPVGSVLGPTGINIGQFVKQFNDATASQAGTIIPVVINIYADRSFSFVMKTPPASILIKKAAGLEHASSKCKKEKVGTLTMAQVREIAQVKMPDLNAATIESAMSMIAGTARSMGITVQKEENKDGE